MVRGIRAILADRRCQRRRGRGRPRVRRGPGPGDGRRVHHGAVRRRGRATGRRRRALPRRGSRGRAGDTVQSPDRPPSARPMTAIRLEVDDEKLQGHLLLPATSTARRCPGVLFVHGWGSSQRQDLRPARRLLAHGHACLTFNLRGHARTRRDIAEVTRAENLRDVAAAYDVLACQAAVDAERIALVGASYGAYLATLLTAERAVCALALQAPALYKDADFDRLKRELNMD